LRQPPGDGEPARGQLLRAVDAAAERQLAPAANHVAEATHLAGHRHRQAAALRELRLNLSVLEVGGRRDRRRRPLAEVEGVALLLLGQIDDRESAAADPGRVGMDDPQRQRGGTGGVDGVAPALESGHAGGRGQRVVGRDRGVRGAERGRRGRAGKSPGTRRQYREDSGHRERPRPASPDWTADEARRMARSEWRRARDFR
jgi:hypothetical protein